MGTRNPSGGAARRLEYPRAPSLDRSRGQFTLYIPGHFVVFVDTRAKRACSKCPAQGIQTQPAMVYGLDRALAGDGLVAKVIVDKNAHHLPLTRQRTRFKRATGVNIAVSTMCGWLKRSAALLDHVVDAIADEHPGY